MTHQEIILHTMDEKLSALRHKIIKYNEYAVKIYFVFQKIFLCRMSLSFTITLLEW